MQVHLLVDNEPHEGTTFIYAYASKKLAQARMDRMNSTLLKWQQKQRRLDQQEVDTAWSNPPHLYHHLRVISLIVYNSPNTKRTLTRNMKGQTVTSEAVKQVSEQKGSVTL